MTVSINTNLFSLKAQRQLNRSVEIVASVFERLSSGQRINRASDDAAGMSIAASLSADRRVYSQAIRNVNDGISALNIVDSGISALSEILVRVEELAQQSANGSYSNKQRIALQAETTSLLKEYNRIVEETSFNGIKLLDAPNNSLSIQSGYGTENKINFLTTSEMSSSVGNQIFTYVFQDYIGNSTHGVVAEDFDRDGDLDIAAVSYFGNTLEILSNDGSGNHVTTQNIGTNTLARAVTSGDFNGDGFADLAITHFSNNQVVTYLNDGTGSFSVGQTIATPSNNGDHLVATDFDGDGRDEIIVGGFSSTFGVLQNDGSGSFSYSSFTPGSTSRGLAVGDADGDGDIDLYVGGGGQIVMYENTGSGSLSATSTFLIGSGISSLELSDLDLDGDLDLVAADETGGTLSVLENTGSGEFTFRQTLATSTGIQDVEVADFNNDGYSDLMDAYGYFALNNGDGSFGAVTSIGLSGSPLELAAEDFTGDGIVDVIAAQGFYTQLYVQGTEKTTSIKTFNILTREMALESLEQIQEVSNIIVQQRGSIGSSLARLQSAASSLSLTTTELAAAESRIVDVDIAAESAELVRNQILLQSTSAILAQANTQPALALILLRNDG